MMYDDEQPDGPRQESWLDVLIIVCVTVTVLTLTIIVFLSLIGVLR